MARGYEVRPDELGTVHIGLGAIGVAVARLVHERGARIVGAVDIAPDLAGRPLAEVLGLSAALDGVTVAGDLADVATDSADVALHCAGSVLAAAAPGLSAAMAAGLHVVSTCEELAYPWDDEPELATRLDREARAAGVTLLGTGVNPGYAMDYLPAVLTAPCRHVTSIDVLRVQEAGGRRAALQRKVGAGLSADEFAAGVAAGRLGHVGLGRSARALAAALGWRLEGVDETIEPLLGDVDGTAGAEDQVSGVHQVATGATAAGQRVRLTLDMGVGVADPREEMHVHGEPELHVTVPGGIPGDVATAALVANVLPRVLAAPPGLLVMTDLPPPRPWG